MILQGDCLAVLKTLPEASVHCVISSPPYWSLRDYGVQPSVWGGNPRCDHEFVSAGAKEGYTSKRKWQHTANGRGEEQPAEKTLRDPVTRENFPEAWNQVEQGAFCRHCGAWCGALRLEPTPDLYVEHIVSVFREVRRVLRKDGTAWVNFGDSYAAGGKGGGGSFMAERGDAAWKKRSALNGWRSAPKGLKAKDLCMIPARCALALQADGWYLRSDIVWAKPNPMPESIVDRPTKSHEFMYLLAKTARYYYDAEAVRESATDTGRMNGRDGRDEDPRARPPGSAPRTLARLDYSALGRNRRSVWIIPTQPTPEAHFATFPEALVDPCLRAGTSEYGCCAICAAPFRRIVEKGEPLAEQKAVSGADASGEYVGEAVKNYDGTGAQNPSAVKVRILEGMRARVTTGWAPTCKCTDAGEPQPCTVIDPFSGAGTVGVVAANLNRRYLGIELNPDYIAIAERRIAAVAPLFNQESA